MEALEGVDDKNRRLEEVTGELYGLLPHMDSRNRPAVKAFVAAVEGIGLFNELGKIIAERDYGLKYGEKPISGSWRSGWRCGCTTIRSCTAVSAGNRSLEGFRRLLCGMVTI